MLNFILSGDLSIQAGRVNKFSDIYSKDSYSTINTGRTEQERPDKENFLYL